MAKRMGILEGWSWFVVAIGVGMLFRAPVLMAAPAGPGLPAIKGPKAEVIPWQKLFADEDWYKKGPPHEIIIRGVLEAVPQPEGPSIIMRTYYYRLRQWNIYTGGKRIKLLDQFVGQEVDILGKEVKMSLEGKELLEFWPAAIRKAMPHPKWPKVPGKPPAAGPGGPSQPVPLPEPSAKESKPPAEEPKPPAEKSSEAAWQKLFADEDWYKQAEGNEQIFRGRLEAIPQGPAIGFLMRTSFYRLGDRNIYTGARKLEVLDRLVGQEVEILGKPVDMALEGRQLREIWAAAVRPVASAKSSSPASSPQSPPVPPTTRQPPSQEKSQPVGPEEKQ